MDEPNLSKYQWFVGEMIRQLKRWKKPNATQIVSTFLILTSSFELSRIYIWGSDETIPDYIEPETEIIPEYLPPVVSRSVVEYGHPEGGVLAEVERLIRAEAESSNLIEYYTKSLSAAEAIVSQRYSSTKLPMVITAENVDIVYNLGQDF